MIKATAVLLLSYAFVALCCLTVAAQQPSIVDDKSEETRTGTISGRVVNESGQPLVNAAVYVRSINSVGFGRITSTDSEGSFQVSGLDPASYLVSASIPTYTSPTPDPEKTEPNFYRVGDSVKLELIKGGVITGTVTTGSGEPVVGVRVRASMIRNAIGLTPTYGSVFRERTTDDRGVYRIYGLAAGTYLVSAGGGSGFTSFNLNPYDNDVPTFAPSGTRDTAVEINVRSGEDTSGVDIRYRGEPGHIVSGSASGPAGAAPSLSGINITMSAVSNSGAKWNVSWFQPPNGRGFSFSGIGDGDYDLIAQATPVPGEIAVSEPRRIRVKGADVTGIELTAKPLGSISGQLVLEESKAAECKAKRRPLFSETLLFAQPNGKNKDQDQPTMLVATGGPAPPDKDGAFTLRNLAAGQYNFNARFFARYWYLQSISVRPAAPPAARAAPANQAVDASRGWTTLKTGERISGLTITLASGAASLRGGITLAQGQKLPSNLLVYLVPAERDKAEDVLRFFTSPVSGDGGFTLSNLPPGHYWVIARAAGNNEPLTNSRLRSPDENTTRAKLRREAEAAKTELEFKPCQNVTDYALPMKM